MEVVSLVPHRHGASTRYRMTQYARHLEKVGLRLRIEPIAPGLGQRVRQLATPRRQSVVLLQRKLLPVWQTLLLRSSCRVLAYDFDDAVGMRDSFHPRGPHSWTRAARFGAAVGLADLVIAGNHYLADLARRWTSAKRVHVVPTCIDSARYLPADHCDRDPIRLVWIGSASTVRTLVSGRALLEAIGAAHPGLVLRVICNRFPRFENLRVERAAWSSDTECASLSSSDIGISWVPDDGWSRGKCGLKVLQYMASGLPVVASPVGVHREMVSHGAGFLARSDREWIDRIGQLAANSRLRRTMGHEGRALQRARFHVDTWGPIFAERLAEAASLL